MRIVLALLVLTLAVPASAQTVEATIDLTALNWGPLTSPQAIETDGDLSTYEWLVRRPFSGMMRVVTERGAGLCAGEWFDPTDGAVAEIAVQRRGLTHVLMVTRPGRPSLMVRLDTPVCDPH